MKHCRPWQALYSDLQCRCSRLLRQQVGKEVLTLLLFSVIITITVVGTSFGTPPVRTQNIAHAAETHIEAAHPHIFLDPAEVHQPVGFSIKIEGSGFPPNDDMLFMTDAGFSGTPACANNSVDGTTVTSDPEGGFIVTGHFMGCIVNSVAITLNDDGHLYRTILDIDCVSG